MAHQQDRVDTGIRVTKINVNETVEKVFFQLSGELRKDQEYYIKVSYFIFKNFINKLFLLRHKLFIVNLFYVFIFLIYL